MKAAFVTMKGNLKYPVILLLLPSGLIALTVLVLMLWRVPTRVLVSVAVSRAEFTVGPSPSSSIRVIDPIPVQSITFERFGTVTFEPAALEVADWSKFDFEKDRFSGSAWRPLTILGPKVSVVPNDRPRRGRVTIEGDAEGIDGAKSLDQIRVGQGARVTLEVRDQGGYAMTITLAGAGHHALLSSPSPFQIIADYVALAGVGEVSASPGESFTLRGQLRRNAPFMEIRGSSEALLLSFKVPRGRRARLFSEGSVPVSAIDFTRQGPGGNRLSALVRGKTGKIRYPDYPGIGDVAFAGPDYVALGALDKFRIKEIRLDPVGEGLELELEGTAGYLRTGSADFPDDHRLTALTELWESQDLAILTTVIVWIFATMVGGYRLYREFAR